MASRGMVRRLLRDRWVLAAILGVALTSWFLVRWISTESSYRVRLTAGRPQGLRHLLAEGLIATSKSRKVAVTLVASAGSEDSLDELDAGRIDLALVQGGLGSGSRKNVRQLAALHLEPLHVLVKEELMTQPGRGLDGLRGRSINVGEPGSGTRVLAVDVLRFAGLEPDSDYRPESLSYERLEAEESRAKLPDAVFTVSLLPSRVARTLVTRHRYRLMPLPFAEAYSLPDSRVDRNTPATEGPAEPRVDRDRVVDAVVPAFTYGVREPVPAEPLRTLGTRMLLVAHVRVPEEVGARVLEGVFGASFAHLSHPPLTPDLLSIPPEFPVHPGMTLYQERTKPLIAGDVIDAVEKQLSIAGAVAGAAFFFWQWLKGRFRRLRESGFEHYILRVAALEQKALELELEPTLDLPGLLALQDELGRLKAAAIAKFAEGELEGEDLLSGFLAQASDARDHLTRLILHRRDDLERRARKEKREAVLLWKEAIERTVPPVVQAGQSDREFSESTEIPPGSIPGGRTDC